MINSKGEVIYTSAEIAYELGISQGTVNAVARRLWGHGRIQHWTLNDVKMICEYIKSISIEEDAKRLAALHDTVESIMGGAMPLDGERIRTRTNADIHLAKGNEQKDEAHGCL